MWAIKEYCSCCFDDENRFILYGGWGLHTHPHTQSSVCGTMRTNNPLINSCWTGEEEEDATVIVNWPTVLASQQRDSSLSPVAYCYCYCCYWWSSSSITLLLLLFRFNWIVALRFREFVGVGRGRAVCYPFLFASRLGRGTAVDRWGGQSLYTSTVVSR